jgi:hypothetical protein
MQSSCTCATARRRCVGALGRQRRRRGIALGHSIQLRRGVPRARRRVVVASGIRTRWRLADDIPAGAERNDKRDRKRAASKRARHRLVLAQIRQASMGSIQLDDFGARTSLRRLPLTIASRRSTASRKTHPSCLPARTDVHSPIRAFGEHSASESADHREKKDGMSACERVVPRHVGCSGCMSVVKTDSPSMRGTHALLSACDDMSWFSFTRAPRLRREQRSRG